MQAISKLHCSESILEEIESKNHQGTYRLIDDYRDELKESFYASRHDNNFETWTKHGFRALVDSIYQGNDEIEERERLKQ